MHLKLRPLKRRALPAWARECLIFAGFLALTALMTWPWALHLRDAVADPGDPYMIAWTLWWDFHQTFSDPLELFHANIFYPYRYTLAFSEHDYGIALLFFPLFAAGLRPLTVHSVATFAGFAFSGYGAFRLARTATGSRGAGWAAGITFAFIPYRFHLLSHLHYLFAGWLPLLLEALLLFARRRTWRRGAWLGVAFLMNALTCVSWFVLSLVPLALAAVLLAARYSLHRDRAFWVRGAVALSAASLLLLPFLLPYVKVSRLYGFKWPETDAPKFSARATDWLAAERRNKLWGGMGDEFPETHSKLFPGLAPVLLASVGVVAASARRRRRTPGGEEAGVEETRIARFARRLLPALDALAVVSGLIALVAAAYPEWRANPLGIKLIGRVVREDLIHLLVAALALRFGLGAYAQLRSRDGGARWIAALRPSPRPDAYWLGLAWALAGFLLSLGMNFALFRVLYEYLLPFRSLRIPARAAMICYVGLALLAGLGAARLARALARRHPRIKPAAVHAGLAAVLLFELRAAPLEFVRGAVEPDGVTLWLKRAPMRGGVVELPSSRADLTNHLYMLRAADHQRPLVNATSSFITEETFQILEMTKGPGIDSRLLDLFEAIPASYVVVRHGLIREERRQDFESFLARAAAAGRLRLILTFADGNALYAVTKTEPGAGKKSDE